jgi:hypothetical protein
VLSALGVLFLLFDATIKVAMNQPVIDSAATLGVPVELMFPIGILELILLAGPIMSTEPFEFYVDLTNTGNLESWAAEQGITPIRPIPPGVRYPASPTMDEVPPERRWKFRILNGTIWLLGPNGEFFEFNSRGAFAC